MDRLYFIYPGQFINQWEQYLLAFTSAWVAGSLNSNHSWIYFVSFHLDILLFLLISNIIHIIHLCINNVGVYGCRAKASLCI